MLTWWLLLIIWVINGEFKLLVFKSYWCWYMSLFISVDSPMYDFSQFWHGVEYIPACVGEFNLVLNSFLKSSFVFCNCVNICSFKILNLSLLLLYCYMNKACNGCYHYCPRSPVFFFLYGYLYWYLYIDRDIEFF